MWEAAFPRVLKRSTSIDVAVEWRSVGSAVALSAGRREEKNSLTAAGECAIAESISVEPSKPSRARSFSDRGALLRLETMAAKFFVAVLGLVGAEAVASSVYVFRHAEKQVVSYVRDCDFDGFLWTPCFRKQYNLDVDEEDQGSAVPRLEALTRLFSQDSPVSLRPLPTEFFAHHYFACNATGLEATTKLPVSGTYMCENVYVNCSVEARRALQTVYPVAVLAGAKVSYGYGSCYDGADKRVDGGNDAAAAVIYELAAQGKTVAVAWESQNIHRLVNHIAARHAPQLTALPPLSSQDWLGRRGHGSEAWRAFVAAAAKVGNASWNVTDLWFPAPTDLADAWNPSDYDTMWRLDFVGAELRVSTLSEMASAGGNTSVVYGRPASWAYDVAHDDDVFEAAVLDGVARPMPPPRTVQSVVDALGAAAQSLPRVVDDLERAKEELRPLLPQMAADGVREVQRQLRRLFER